MSIQANTWRYTFHPLWERKTETSFSLYEQREMSGVIQLHGLSPSNLPSQRTQLIRIQTLPFQTNYTDITKWKTPNQCAGQEIHLLAVALRSPNSKCFVFPACLAVHWQCKNKGWGVMQLESIVSHIRRHNHLKHRGVGSLGRVDCRCFFFFI